MQIRTTLVIACLSVLTANIGRADEAHHENPWQIIKEKDGITVWNQVVDGTSLVRFRATGIVDHPADVVAAVMTDHNRAIEWTKNTVESSDLQVDGNRMISYNHTESPVFIVSDRDVVVQTVLTYVPESKTIRGDFKDVHDARKPEKEGIVRIVALEGYFELKHIDAGHTQVTYQVMLDPGGSIPMFVVNWGAKDVAFETLANLRKQTEKPGYEAMTARIHQMLDLSTMQVAADAP